MKKVSDGKASIEQASVEQASPYGETQDVETQDEEKQSLDLNSQQYSDDSGEQMRNKTLRGQIMKFMKENSFHSDKKESVNKLKNDNGEENSADGEKLVGNTNDNMVDPEVLKAVSEGVAEVSQRTILLGTTQKETTAQETNDNILLSILDSFTFDSKKGSLYELLNSQPVNYEGIKKILKNFYSDDMKKLLSNNSILYNTKIELQDIYKKLKRKGNFRHRLSIHLNDINYDELKKKLMEQIKLFSKQETAGEAYYEIYLLLKYFNDENMTLLFSNIEKNEKELIERINKLKVSEDEPPKCEDLEDDSDPEQKKIIKELEDLIMKKLTHDLVIDKVTNKNFLFNKIIELGSIYSRNGTVKTEQIVNIWENMVNNEEILDNIISEIRIMRKHVELDSEMFTKIINKTIDKKTFLILTKKENEIIVNKIDIKKYNIKSSFNEEIKRLYEIKKLTEYQRKFRIKNIEHKNECKLRGIIEKLKASSNEKPTDILSPTEISSLLVVTFNIQYKHPINQYNESSKESLANKHKKIRNQYENQVAKDLENISKENLDAIKNKISEERRDEINAYIIEIIGKLNENNNDLSIISNRYSSDELYQIYELKHIKNMSDADINNIVYKNIENKINEIYKIKEGLKRKNSMINITLEIVKNIKLIEKKIYETSYISDIKKLEEQKKLINGSLNYMLKLVTEMKEKGKAGERTKMLIDFLKAESSVPYNFASNLELLSSLQKLITNVIKSKKLSEFIKEPGMQIINKEIFSLFEENKGTYDNQYMFFLACYTFIEQNYEQTSYEKRISSMKLTVSSGLAKLSVLEDSIKDMSKKFFKSKSKRTDESSQDNMSSKYNENNESIDSTTQSIAYLNKYIKRYKY